LGTATSSRPDETFTETAAFVEHLKTASGCLVTVYLLMTGLGFVMFLGARYTDRSIARHEPKLARIEPAIPRICFVAKSLGMMIAVAGLGATANLIAWS
jgi:hypothetical protein